MYVPVLVILDVLKLLSLALMRRYKDVNSEDQILRRQRPAETDKETGSKVHQLIATLIYHDVKGPFCTEAYSTA